MVYGATSPAVAKRYVLGTTPRLKISPKDQDGIFFIPTLSRLSVKHPSGTIYTYSGGDLTLASGFLYLVFPYANQTGWYEYESWVRDGNGIEDAQTKGFEIYDRVYPD